MASVPPLSWSKVDLVGDPPPHRWSYASCAVGTDLFMSGGFRDESNGGIKVLADAWLLKYLDNDRFLWKELPAPPTNFKPRFFHTATRVGDLIWLIGGRTGNQETCSDVFTYNIRESEWKQVEIKGPNAVFLERSLHSAISGPTEPHKIFIYGGVSNPQRSHKPPVLVMPDTKHIAVTPTITRPAIRTRRSLSIPTAIDQNRVLFLGGVDLETEKPVETVAVYNVEQKTWTEMANGSPYLRDLSGAVAVLHKNKIYVHGGKNKDNNVSYNSQMVRFAPGSSASGEDCAVQRFVCQGLPGICDHAVLSIGSCVYVCMGRFDDKMLNHAVYKTDLDSIHKVFSSIPRKAPRIEPAVDLTESRDPRRGTLPPHLVRTEEGAPTRETVSLSVSKEEAERNPDGIYISLRSILAHVREQMSDESARAKMRLEELKTMFQRKEEEIAEAVAESKACAQTIRQLQEEIKSKDETILQLQAWPLYRTLQYWTLSQEENRVLSDERQKDTDFVQRVAELFQNRFQRGISPR